MSNRKIFISAGEPSGDLHGGKLVSELRALDKGLKISAIGGNCMQAAGADLLLHIRETAFMGFAEVIRHLPRIRKNWKRTIRWISTEKPELVVLIDYPGFNLRLAKACFRRNIRVIYYISPQLWAWHSSRVKKIRSYVSEVLCILPFEEEWYRQRNVKASFVGHPLLDQMPESNEIKGDIIPRKPGPSIGLFPGSRAQEIEKHLVPMLQAVGILKEEFPQLTTQIAIAQNLDLSHYQAEYSQDWIRWRAGQNHTIMQNADLLIMSSGTASLEATLQGTPAIVIYKLSGFSYWLGKRVVRVPFIAIPNLIAERGGFPELIQHDATPEKIARTAREILENPQKAKEIQSFMASVTEKLGQAGASVRAARKIYDHLLSTESRRNER